MISFNVPGPTDDAPPVEVMRIEKGGRVLIRGEEVTGASDIADGFRAFLGGVVRADDDDPRDQIVAIARNILEDVTFGAPEMLRERMHMRAEELREAFDEYGDPPVWP